MCHGRIETDDTLKTISMDCSVFGLDFKMRTKSKKVDDGAGWTEVRRGLKQAQPAQADSGACAYVTSPTELGVLLCRRADSIVSRLFMCK